MIIVLIVVIIVLVPLLATIVIIAVLLILAAMLVIVIIGSAAKLANLCIAKVQEPRLTARRSKHRLAAGIGPGRERRRGTGHTDRLDSRRLDLDLGLGAGVVGRSRRRNDLPADVRTSWGAIRW